MKRYIFSFSLWVLCMNGGIFNISDEAYFLTVFTKEDVAKYWLVKQLNLLDNVKKDVIEEKINSLLASMKRKLIKHESELFKMDLEKFAYARMDKDSPVDAHYFAFDETECSSKPRPIASLLYTEGRMWGGGGIPEFHEFWSDERMRAKKSLCKRMALSNVPMEGRIDLKTLPNMSMGEIPVYSPLFINKTLGVSAQESIIAPIEWVVSDISSDATGDGETYGFIGLQEVYRPKVKKLLFGLLKAKKEMVPNNASGLSPEMFDPFDVD